MKSVIAIVLTVFLASPLYAEEQRWGYEGVVDRLISLGLFESFSVRGQSPVIEVSGTFLESDLESQNEVAIAVYDECQSMNKRYKVIHLIHGSTGEHIGVINQSGLHLD